jgi:hypothetical protein
MKLCQIIFAKFIGVLLVVLITQSTLGHAAEKTSFLTNPYWDQGNAEFQVYKALLTRYGIRRDGQAKIIIVKELFDPAKLVKTNKPAPAIEVIKMNYIQTMPTGVYDYYQMASFFFERLTGKIIKYSMSSQDGCGTTFMEYVYQNKNGHFVFHSYFDDEGDVTVEFKTAEPPVFYDALPLVLRFRLQGKTPYTLQIVQPLIAIKFTRPALIEARITTRLISPFSIGGRQLDSIYETTVETSDTRDVFYFEPAFPHRLVKWKKSNNDELLLKSAHFFRYWEYTKPGDEQRIK